MPRSILPLSLVLLVAVAGCDSLSMSGDATFTGTVLDAVTSDPIEGATVRVEGTAATTTTDAAGAYSLTVEADSTDQRFTITVTAPGFEAASVIARADVDDTVVAPLVALDPVGGGTGGGGSTGSGPGTSITLDGRTSETVGVQGAGAVETATLTFVVLDGQGRPVSAANAADLTFTIANGPGGGETIDPTSATTNAEGEARVTLTSGTRAGTVQVLASGTINGQTVRSLPVTITITGGLPDDAHFSVAPEQLNFAGYNRLGLTNPVTAFVGDIYGNPVQPGTAVYFTTDGGIIPGSGVTDPRGTTTVELLSAAPLPANAFSCPGGTSPNGYGLVTARTSDLDQQTIEAQTTVLFSGETQIAITEPAGLEIGDYAFTVSDQFGHPLAPNTRISVAAGGVNVTAVGDANFTLGDHLCPGPGRTQFRVGIAPTDTSDEADPPQINSFSITVTSPNGNARLTRTASGRHRVTGDVFRRLD